MQEDETKMNQAADKQRRENLRTLMTVFVIPAVAVVLLLKVFFSLFFIPSSSMEPTLHRGSLQIGWRLPYLMSDPMPERGDIVVFRSDGKHELLVKRVIGIEGDEVRLTDGVVYLNGEALSEPYLPDNTITSGEFLFTVPKGCILLLGDNRNDSVDARYWQEPYVSIQKVIAEVLLHANA